MPMAIESRSAHALLFVYGPLLRGYTSHLRYLSVAEGHGGATLLHTAVTARPFALAILPQHVLPSTCGPVLMECDGEEASATQVRGEVYRVSHTTLQALDLLERVAEGPQYRHTIDVIPETSPTDRLACFVYLHPSSPELLALPRKDRYGEEEHAVYIPSPHVDPEIVNLCQSPTHGLHTTRSRAMRVHCVRLLPGEDVLRSLKNFVESRSIRAAALISAVGSTATTVLRPAGMRTSREFVGKFEVVSLSGTIGGKGHHLHMSISDSECKVLGGHVMPGCIVRTTLEVIIGEIEGVEFSRPTDTRTGFDEVARSE